MLGMLEELRTSVSGILSYLRRQFRFYCIFVIILILLFFSDEVHFIDWEMAGMGIEPLELAIMITDFLGKYMQMLPQYHPSMSLD